jgi:hypothetical protein
MFTSHLLFSKGKINPYVVLFCFSQEPSHLTLFLYFYHILYMFLLLRGLIFPF